MVCVPSALADGLDDAARTVLFEEGLAARQHEVARVVPVLGLFRRIEVVQGSVELVEAVVGGQVLVAVAEVVLAELAGGVALLLEHGGDGDVLLLPALGGARQADLGHAGAHRHGAAHERRAPGGA